MVHFNPHGNLNAAIRTQVVPMDVDEEAECVAPHVHEYYRPYVSVESKENQLRRRRSES